MLTAAWKPLKPHRQQSKLYFGTERFVAVCAGRGSGKTELARRYLVRQLSVRKPWPDPEYFYAWPTLGQGRTKGWDKLKPLIPDHWIQHIDESRMRLTTVFGSTLQILGTDVAVRNEGQQYDGGVLDESSDQLPGVFKLTFLPMLTHRSGWCWRIGVAKRRGVGSQEFRKCCEQWASKMGDGTYAHYTWPSTDILSPEEIQIMRDSMDERDFNEQFLSSWESDAGLVYYGFNELQSIMDVEYHDDQPIIVGSDFNVDPMAWVMMHMIGKGNDAEFHVFDELWERNTNTQRCLDALHERYKDHKGGWFFFGDASGRARKTSAAKSDYIQIKNDIRFTGPGGKGASRVLYPEANPFVADRIAAVNALLRAASGKRRLYVHSRCKHLIRDLSFLAYDPHSREIDDRDPDAKHITDALGYPLSYLRPLRTQRRDDDEEASTGAGVAIL